MRGTIAVCPATFEPVPRHDGHDPIVVDDVDVLGASFDEIMRMPTSWRPVAASRPPRGAGGPGRRRVLVDGIITATYRGTSVAVGPGQSSERW